MWIQYKHVLFYIYMEMPVYSWKTYKIYNAIYMKYGNVI